MAQTSLIIGDTNWAVKEDSLLGYNVIQNNYLPIPIDCVRATTATRVNEQGLIEIVPRNLFTYSEDFANAAWTKANVTVSSNVINSPIGTLTADKLVENSANDIHYINGASITFTAGTYTVSIFAKAAERNVLQIFLNGSANVDAYANFNLTTGVVSAFNAATATIQSVGNGWYRCNLTAIIAASIVPSAYFCIQTSTTATRAASYLGDGVSGIFIWGAQLENGSVATEYFPTTDRLDIPRIDYSTGTASLLVEPQRTNQYPYSQQFNQWSIIGGITVTENDAISPDGTQNADRAQFTLSTDLLYRSGTGSAGSNTLTVYAKAKSGTSQKFRFFGNGGLSYSSDQVATNQWQRFTFTYTYSATTAGLAGATTGAGDVLFYGFQHELGTYPTSYIPTIASSVTRNADIIGRTGISGLIGQTEGTMYCEINLPNPNSPGGLVMIQIGTGASRIYIAKDSNTQNIIQLATQSSSGYNFINTSNITTSTIKMAIAYKNGDNAFYVNGSLISSASGTTNPNSFSQISLGDISFGNTDIKVKTAILYKTRLTNSELQLLTTI